MPEDINISVAKIVATPSQFSWSQAYNAGKLFAAISLSKETSHDEKDYLNILGKETIETLEQEFFGLEVKDLSSIKIAFETAFAKVPEDVECSFAVASIVKNVVYILSFGDIRANIKRGDEFGVLIDSNEQKGRNAVSGILQNGDTIIIQTKQFKELVPPNVLIGSFDHQSAGEIAETVAPIIHKEARGGAAAIILQCKIQEETPAEFVSKELGDKEAEADRLMEGEEKKFNFAAIISKVAGIVKIPKIGRISHLRKLILSIVIVIAVLFAGVIIISIQKQNDAKVNALFESVYPKAAEKYKEGESLLSLNKNLARDSFLEAYKILNDNKSKFPKNSKQEKKVLDLLSKTQKGMEETSGVSFAKAKEENENASPLLSTEIRTGSSFIASDDKNIYFIKNGAVAHDKGNDKEKTVIKSSDLPSNTGGLGAYNGNIYILDKDKNQIYKFAGSDYTKSNYFSSSPSLSNAKAIAIDGSIWILIDRNIAKYTKGKSDNLNVSGLDKPLSNPTRIFTDADTDNIYILDNGNSRIVVLNKKGEYQAQYQTDILKGAKDFEVIESSKKIYILSNNKIYKIDIK